MHISFDIDDTLVCDSSVPVELEDGNCWQRWRYPERLRQGTFALMRALMRRRCKIWIYTTSNRSVHYLKSWFQSYGIPIAGVINQTVHEQQLGERGPSKYPPAFGIDLHVDDSVGVAMEGEAHRFEVLVIDPHDLNWAQHILQEVDARIAANPYWEARFMPRPVVVEVEGFFPLGLVRAWRWMTAVAAPTTP